MKNLSKTLVLSFILLLAFSTVRPAKAFYLEVPQNVKGLLALFASNKALAQDAGTYQGIGTPPGTGTGYQGIGPTPGQNQGYQGIGPTPGQNMGYQGIGPAPGTQTGPQGGMQGGQGGPSPEQQAKQMAQMKRGMKQMASQVKQFEQMIANAEKNGTTIPDEIKANLAKLKGILDSVQNAQSMDDLQNIDMSEMQDLMQSLEDFRQNTIQKAQELQSMKRGLRGMESAINMLEKQIAKLTKQGITIPADISDHATKLRAIINAIKNAKSADDIDQNDLESLPDLMDSFNQDRQQLEILSRWPQTLKQIDRQLTQLTRELAKSKVIVDRLATKGIDIQSEYTAFADGVNKLKSVRDDAVAKMAAGNSDDAFSALQEDFFGQMDDVWQHQRVITTMSNLGRFASQFKQNVARSISVIKNLKRKKVDTADLEALLQQTSDKGQEILNMLNAGNIDEDTVTAALDDLENIKQEFDAKVSDLTGQGQSLPWEQGPQFDHIPLPQGLDKLINQTQSSSQGGQNLAKCTPAPSGLVAWWNADAVSGATATDIKGGNNGTISNATVVPGKVGNAFKFNGTNGNINMGNPTSLNFGTAPFSLEAWVKWDGGGSYGALNIIRKSNYGPDPGAGYWLRIGRDAKTIEFSVGSTTGPDGQTLVTTPFSSGVWHHVVATRDSSDTAKLYIDGESAGTIVRKASKAQSTSGSSFTLGNWADQGSEFFPGLIDEISIYNQALDASDVKAIFNADSAGKCNT